MQPDPAKASASRTWLTWAKNIKVVKKPFYLAIFLALLTVFLAGTWYGSRRGVKPRTAGDRRILHYVDPMNPAHTSPEPGLAPCGMKMEPVYAENGDQPLPPANLPPGAVKVNPQKQQLIGVRVGVVEKNPYAYTFRALGKVVIDETRIYRMNAFVDGWILKTFNNSTGSLVMKDEPLATFYSREFITSEQGYFYALSTLDRLRKGDQLIENQLTSTSAQIRGAEENLENLGMSKSQIKELARTRRLTQDIELRAPVTSFVLARNVSPGQKIAKSEELYKLADLSHVWIQADLYENEGQFVRAGLKVQARLPNQNKSLWATVSDTLPIIDPVTRTLKVRLETDNPDYALRPDMFVDVEFPINLPAAISVPAEAVLDSGLKKTVFVDRGNGYFEPRKVETGWRLGDRVEITEGLKPGEKIVTSGNFLIDSESRMRLAAAGIYGEASKDPVCGVNLDESKAKAAGHQVQIKEKTYYFCSEECQEQFEKHPERYIKDNNPEIQASAVGAGDKKPEAPVMAKDPVSGLEVDPDFARAMGLKREYQGKIYYFRQAASLEKFDLDPQSYINQLTKAEATAPAPVQEQAKGTIAPLHLGEPKTYGGYHEQEKFMVKALGLDKKVDLPEPLKEIPVTDHDPVCGVKLGEDAVQALVHKTPYKGKLYYFCSEECKKAFDLNPEEYANKATTAPATPAAPMVAMDKGQLPGGQAHQQPNPPDVMERVVGPNTDPVCGIDLSQKGRFAAYPKSSYRGKLYYFCSDHCKKVFDQDPERYLHKPKQSAIVSPPIAPPGMHKDARGRPLAGPTTAAAPTRPGGEGR